MQLKKSCPVVHCNTVIVHIVTGITLIAVALLNTAGLKTAKWLLLLLFTSANSVSSAASQHW
jgi:hypothetical protein